MKTLRIHFCHPIKGIMHLFEQGKDGNSHVLPVDSEGEDLLEVPLGSYKKGKWKVVLEWEYDGRDYIFERNIVIS